MRKLLLRFFSDRTTAIALAALVFGTNWLEYSSFTGGMTHNYLFLIYVFLILTSIEFYKKPTFSKSAIIGLLVGIAALMRPTEILAALIPLLWVNELEGKKYIEYKIDFFKEHLSKLLLAAAICLAIGSIQLIYWKYASGDWIVYSYEDQGFNFLKPYVAPFMWSFKTGWLVYSPMMIFALIGFYPLYKKNRTLFITCLAFFAPFLWVAFSWKIWNYGGCIGQRTMVQAYPILLFPLAYFIDWIFTKKMWKRVMLSGFAMLFCYYNLWLTHHAHLGGIFKAGHMTQAYWWKTLFTNTPVESDLKLLDAKEEFIGERENVRQVYFNDFEKIADDFVSIEKPIEGSRSAQIVGKDKKTPIFFTDVSDKDFEWARVSADFKRERNQWIYWKMTDLKIRFYNEETVVYEQRIRINRFLEKEK